MSSDAGKFERARDLFLQARDLAPDERSSFLKQACSDDPELLQEVESLLASEAAASTAFENPVLGEGFHVMQALPASAPMPKSIGPYHLVELLGEGGMGTVYKAEQRHPIRRTVALKLVKAGVDTAEVIARFESERQALARMEHPNIARVIDVGTTELGRPYFVMEYVPGTPITKFADDHKLSIRERLLLFTQACDAIAHAHTKAIIHRDIKSSNVLAYMHDSKPAVKVIDFGIAKALTGDRLTDQTFNTGRGVVVGTYDSMSPEQADGSPDIDTRTDVYSLGVLLYEMLTGAKPFDTDTLAKAADLEIRRIIREVEPPKPSTRLSGLGNSATKIAAARQAKVDQLTRELRRELEWIPLKAMRKERQRRYASPLQLAEDIHNYLGGQPLIAGPESRIYRAGKFIVRHRASVLGTAAAVVAIVFALVVMAIQKHQLTKEHGRTVDALAQRTEEQARTKAALAESKASRARIAAQRGDMTTAAAAYKEAMESGHPDPLAMQIGRIRCLVALNQQTRARQEFAQLLTTYPGAERNPRVAYVVAELYWAYDRPKAEKAVAVALAGDIDPADRDYLKALVCEDLIQSRDLLADALRHDPYHHDALGYYCATECLLGELDTARRYTEFWMTLFPNDPTAKVIGALTAAFRGDTESAKRLAAEADATGVVGAPGTVATVVDLLARLLDLLSPGSDRSPSEMLPSLIKMASLTRFSPSRPSDDLNFPLPAAFARIMPPGAELAFALYPVRRIAAAREASIRLAQVWPVGAAYLIAGRYLLEDQPDETHLQQSLTYLQKAIDAPSPVDVRRLAAISAAKVELMLMQKRGQDHAAIASTLLKNYAVIKEHGGLHPTVGPGEPDFEVALAMGSLAGHWDIVRSVAEDWLARDSKNLHAVSLNQMAEYNLGNYGAAVLASEPLLRAGEKDADRYYELSLKHLGLIGPPDSTMTSDQFRQRMTNVSVFHSATSSSPATTRTAPSRESR